MYRIFLTTFFLLTASISTAWAAPKLRFTQPSAGQSLSSPPDFIKIYLSDPLRGTESAIHVYDAQNKEVPGELTTSQAESNTLTYKLPKLASGTYTVKWKAVCYCQVNNTTEQSYSFSVK